MYADIDRMREVFTSNIDAKAKIVLFALIYHVNKDTGEAFPSWDTLATETGLSRSTVSRSVKRLEETGFISKRRRSNGGLIYVLKARPSGAATVSRGHRRGCHADTGGVTLIPGGVTQTPGGCHADTGVVSHRHPNKSIEQKKETKATTSSEGRDTGNELKMFDEFWTAYPAECPQKVNKTMCRTKYSELLSAAEDPAEFHMRVLSGLKTWRRSDLWHKENGRFIRAPLTWLNNCSWEDEPAPVKRSPAGGDVPVEIPERLFVYNWELCAERCSHCTGDGCRMGVTVPPAQEKFAMPPEECRHFSRLVA